MKRPSRRETARVTLELLGRADRHRGVLILAVASMVVASFAEVAPIALAKGAVGVLFPGSSEEPSAIASWFLRRGEDLGGLVGAGDADPRMAALAVMVALVLVVGAVSSVATFAATYFSRLMSALVVIDLRGSLMEKVLGMHVGWFTKRRTGDILSRFATDVEKTYAGLNTFLLVLVHKPIILVLAVGAAFALNWRLALAAMVVLPVLVLPVVRIGKKINKHSRRSLAQLGLSTEAVNESLAGLRVIKAFGAEEVESKRYRDLNLRWLDRQRSLYRATASGRGVMDAVYAVSLAVVLGLGGGLVVTGKWSMDHETFVAFLVALATMYRPVRQLTKAYHEWQASMAAAARVFEVLESRPPAIAPGPLRPIGPVAEGIVFDRVSFAYRDDDGPETPVLHEVSFEIPYGESVALVGPSGSGKSTIADLIFRFRRADGGRILVDGRPIESIDPKSLLEQIAIVSQRPFVFNATIRENIAYGRPDATREEIEAAARAASIHDRIAALPEGYESLAGARGEALSGGEMQRLTIARALLKNASFLILDEATSNLDAESEREVQRALRRLMRGRTTLIIAHRLSTIVQADRILVIEDGRIVEQGGHDDLLRREGTYARLFRAQGG